MILPECTDHCGRRTANGKCPICAKICPHCVTPIDNHEEGKLRNCLIKLGKQVWD